MMDFETAQNTRVKTRFLLNYLLKRIVGKKMHILSHL